jgi:hypothetical protein
MSHDGAGSSTTRMIQALPLIPIIVLVGVPVLVLPMSLIGTLGALAGLSCAAGTLGRARPLVTTGGSLALVQYALALSLAGGPPSLLGAAAFGVALVLVLDVTEFVRRFRRATLAPPAVWRQVRHWIGSTVTGALVAVALATVATALGVSGRGALSPLLAAIAALGTVAGVIGALRGAQGPGSSSRI